MQIMLNKYTNDTSLIGRARRGSCFQPAVRNLFILYFVLIYLVLISYLFSIISICLFCHCICWLYKHQIDPTNEKVVFWTPGYVPATKMNHFCTRNPIFDVSEAQIHEKYTFSLNRAGPEKHIIQICLLNGPKIWKSRILDVWRRSPHQNESFFVKKSDFRYPGSSNPWKMHIFIKSVRLDKLEKTKIQLYLLNVF